MKLNIPPIFSKFCLSAVFFLPIGLCAQTNLFTNHYSLYNPGATGVVYQHDFSSTTVFRKDVFWGELANYNFRVKPLHGAVGLNIASVFRNGGGLSYPTLNYSFLLPTKKQGMFGFGVSAGLDHMFIPTINPNFTPLKDVFVLGTGIHYSSKGFNVGVAGRATPKYLHKGAENAMSAAFYIDYVWNLTDGFGIQPALLLTDIYEKNNQMSLRFIALKKYWIGGSVSDYNIGFMAGFGIGENVNLGYSVEIDNDNNLYYQQTGDSRVVRNSINLSIRFLPKEEMK